MTRYQTTSDVTNTCCCNRGKVSQTNKQTNHMIRYQTKPDYTHACSCNRGKVDSRREEDAQMLGLNARQIQNHLKGGTRNDKIRGILIFQSIPWWRSFNFFLLYECIYICVQNNSFPKTGHQNYSHLAPVIRYWAPVIRYWAPYRYCITFLINLAPIKIEHQ